MPGLVSVKSPPDSAPLQVSVPDAQRSEPVNSKPPSPLPKKLSSPSSSRSKFSPRKPPPETPTLDLNPNSDSALENPDLGPFLLKLARDAIASGEGPTRALDYALRASQSFERCAPADGEPSLDLAMSLHVLAAIYCSLGRFEEAVPVLERAIRVPDPPRGADHALAAFSGFMQLGDTYSMLGQVDKSIVSYEEGLKIQIEALGESDPRVGETCRYLSEAHVQAMEFDRAEELCKKTLEIHHVHSEPASLEEAADRRLMALICEAKGDYETALEHLVLASMAMIANGQDTEVAAIDVSIGSIYMSLCRYDEALFSYQKALTVFKSSKGENHPSVASVFAHLADLYHRTGKLRDSKSYCENALKIYAKPVPGATAEDIAGGLTEISAIYESVDEPEEALKLLQKAMKMLEDKPGQQSTIAGIEARMGVMFYMVGSYEEARNSFESAIAKLRACEKSLEFADQLMDRGSKAIKDNDLDEAAECFSRALEIRVAHYGELAPECVLAYYKYGCALLYKAQDEADPLGAVPKKESDSQQDSAKDGSVKNAINRESTSASVSDNVEEEASTTHQDGAADNVSSGKDQEEEDEDSDSENLAEADEDESDLDLAWKMLDVARAIVEKHSNDSMEKVDILSALAEVALEREDIETSLSDYQKALSLLERLVEQDFYIPETFFIVLSLYLNLSKKYFLN